MTVTCPIVGEELVPRMFGPVTLTELARFAGASGHFDPVHHDPDYAHAAGFPGVFSMGMYQGSLLATFAAERFGAERIRRFRARFLDPVFVGDSLTCKGMVTSVEPCATETVVEVALECGRHAGAPVVTATATFVWVHQPGAG